MRFPALAIAFLFATGILAGGIFTPTLSHAIGAILAASLLLLVLGVALLRRHVTLAWIASLLAWSLLGAAAIHIERLRVPADRVTRLVAENRLELGEPLRWRGQLRSDPLRLPWGIRYDVDLDQVQSAGTWIPVSGGLRTDYFFDERSREAPPRIRAGDSIEVLLRARLVRNFADPGVTDHRALMADQNIYLTGSPRNTTLIEKIHGPPPTIANRLARARGRLLSETDAMLAGSPASAAVARAMLLGDRSFLDSQQMLVAALLWVGRKLRLPLVARTFVTLAALAAYVAVVEDRTPIVRASLMAAAYLLGRLLFRRTHLLNAIGLAALLILLARPSELTDASFLMFFLAVGVIAGIAVPWLESAVEPYLRALDHLGDVARDGAHPPRAAQFRLDARATVNWFSAHLPRIVSRLGTSLVTVPARTGLRLWELVVISAALQVGMIPLMAQYFHRISLVGFAANLPAVLLTGIIVPLGFAALCTSLVWGALGHVLGRALAAMVGTLLWSVNWFASAPRVSFRVPSPHLLIAAFFLAALACASAVLSARRRVAWIAGAAVLASASLIAAYPFAPRLNRGRLEVTVLDVGQGDSIFVAFPNGRTMLVDGGGLPGGNYIRGARPGIDVGEDVVSPFLWSRGLKRLDVVALTHAHEDHYGGLAAVLRNFQVGELWLGHDADSQGYRALLAEAHALRIPIVRRVRGESFDWAGVHLGVLWPADDAPVKTASNDDSLVMRLEDGQETMLLTGDIENRVERALTKDGDPLSADFLKVPHHGSKTSSTQAFLDAVHPRLAVISVGEDNGFGQPNAEVLDRIQQQGARLYRTDHDGAVTALSDGRQVTMHSFLENPDHLAHLEKP